MRFFAADWLDVNLRLNRIVQPHGVTLADREIYGTALARGCLSPGIPSANPAALVLPAALFRTRLAQEFRIQ
jgi:hypothetical protein